MDFNWLVVAFLAFSSCYGLQDPPASEPNLGHLDNSSAGLGNLGSVLNLKTNDDAHYNVEEKLKENLLKNYNKDIRPSAYHNQSVSITFGIFLTHFELNEVRSSITLHAWLRMTWKDDRLQWNVNEYLNVSVIRVPSHNLWHPDLALYNNANAGDMMRFGDETLALIYSDGSVLYVPPVTFESLCSLDLSYWPYDTQVCYLKFGSWTHDGSKLDLSLYSNSTEIDVGDYFKNLQWDLLNTTANVTVDYYECCPEPYPSIDYSLTIRRRSTLFRATVIAPGFGIALLTLIAFFLPPNSTEKLLIGLLDLLILCFFLVYFNVTLPVLDHVPLIVSFYSNTTVLVILSVILAIVNIVLTRTPILHGPPHIIKSFVVGFPGKFLGLGHLIHLVNKIPESIVDQQQAQQERITTRSTINSLNQNELEWLLLASALDRITFLICLVAFVIMMFSFV